MTINAYITMMMMTCTTRFNAPFYSNILNEKGRDRNPAFVFPDKLPFSNYFYYLEPQLIDIGMQIPFA